MLEKKLCKNLPDLSCLSEDFCVNYSCSRQGALNKAFEDSPIGEAFVSKDGSFIFTNKAYADILGYSMSEMKDLTYKQVTYEEDLKIDEPQAIAVANGSIKSYNMEKRYIKKDGSIVWAHLYVNGFFDSKEEFQYYVVYVIKIEDLKNEKMLTDFVTEAGDVGVWVWNLSTGSLTWNKEMYKIFGIKEGTKVNYDDWESSLHPEDRRRVKNELKNALNNKNKFDTYFKIIVNGKTKYIRAKAKITSTDPSLILTGSNIDVTDFKEMQKEINKNHDELEYFTYSVSHDLKSPLVTLSGFSSIISHELNNEVVDWEFIKDSANEIAKATQSLASTIDSILHLSRVGRIYIENTIVNTKDLIDEILNLNSNKIKNSDTKIINSNNINMFVQKEIFSSILQNLIINSIEHAKIDNKTLTINIDFEETEHGFFFSFSDNGKGMSEEQLKNLFNYSNRQYAKGFGMMIIKKGIDFHGGELEVKSELGVGTRFKVYFTHND